MEKTVAKTAGLPARSGIKLLKTFLKSIVLILGMVKPLAYVFMSLFIFVHSHLVALNEDFGLTCNIQWYVLF